MDLLDVNVLVNAYRRDAPRHREFKDYLQSLVDGDEPFAIPAVVFSGFFGIVTHSRIFTPPSTFSDALLFAQQLKDQLHCLVLVPGESHWDVFTNLCVKGAARGGLVSDAYLAAMAIEVGAELVTDNRGFGRWPGLRWRHPIDD
ncbi:MAG: type II toxin-antitoxin system VapC family toxin [Pirellulales bacterium]